MLRFLFTRFGSQYREGGIITGRFQYTASGRVWTKLTTLRETSHASLTMADRGAVGLATLGFESCRLATILSARVESLGDLIANQFQVQTYAPNASAGTCSLVITNLAATPAVVEPTDGSIVVVSMYVAK